ncbi:MAG: ABC transporter ATP-binding protein [Brasilonema sp.]
MKSVIEVRNVNKSYKIREESASFVSLISGLFSKKYKTQKVLKNISLSLHQGECLGFLGPNGAGKSTLIKILCGIQSVDSGSVRVLGEDPHKRKKSFYKRIGVVFGHKTSLWWDLPLKESFAMAKIIYDIEDKVFQKTFYEITKLLDLNHVLKQPVRTLSLGERVKGELAMNLLFQPKILFLDEPTLGLDIISKHEIRQLLNHLRKNNGMSVFLTTHDMGDIEGYCDRVILVDKGKLHFDGSIETLKSSMTQSHKITLYFEDPEEFLKAEELMKNICQEKEVQEEATHFDKSQGKITVICPLNLEGELFIKFSKLFKANISINSTSLEEILIEKYKALRNSYE